MGRSTLFPLNDFLHHLPLSILWHLFFGALMLCFLYYSLTLQASSMIILDLAYMSMMLLPQDINLTTTSINIFLNMPTFFKYVY
jgi:hypothetical protein